MEHKITVMPENCVIYAGAGRKLLEVLRKSGAALDAPCGGNGRCGKCRVLVDGREVLACRTAIDRDMTVAVPEGGGLRVLRDGTEVQAKMNPLKAGPLLAIDIGTTSVVCFLLDGRTGRELASASMLNPQTAYGADVISRIQAALAGALEDEARMIREGVAMLIRKTCGEGGIVPEDVGVAAIVGNPAMQQLFLGISPQNLAGAPFAPVLTEAKAVPCKEYLPLCKSAELLIVPDISGYVGADTLGCVLSTEIYQREEPVLLVDIGTNGEMVLGDRRRMIACSTAAGPTLEGASIRFGMRGTDGAIDHVWLADGEFRCSVIGGGEAKGICGSGLIDAAAALLDSGLLNKRGRLQTAADRDGQRIALLADGIYLTQDDIRQIQLAKGAIHAGIVLMARQLGLELRDIRQVLLAGAFGNYLNPASACRIGLLPPELEGRITAAGNAAGSGARLLACDRDALALSQELRERIEFLELASLPDFPRIFAKSMNFKEEAL